VRRGGEKVRRLRVASYNVHRFVGRDRRRDPGRTAAVLRELDADVVALQEVESAPLAELARAGGYRIVPGPTLSDPEGEYGNALLSRLAVRGVEAVDLSVAGFEPRGALAVELGLRDGPLHVVATHLGLGRIERRSQVQRLLRHLEPLRDTRLMLLGDMNEWLPFRGGLAPLDAFFHSRRRVRSFPSRWPVLALDRIWARPRRMLAALCAHRSPLARLASDHLPVRAELDLVG
jgi:phospholipase D1/2